MSRPKVRPVPYDLDAMAEAVATRGPTPGNYRSLAEWQYAADLAEFVLLLDATRQFGLITGGPAVNVEAAERIIAGAARHDITPALTDELRDRCLAELVADADVEAAEPTRGAIVVDATDRFAAG